VASDWKDGLTVDALVSGDDIWSALAADRQDGLEFAEELKQRSFPGGQRPR